MPLSMALLLPSSVTVRTPEHADTAHEAMAPWLETGFWNSGAGHTFASFMLGVALHLQRRLLEEVLQRRLDVLRPQVLVVHVRLAVGEAGLAVGIELVDDPVHVEAHL